MGSLGRRQRLGKGEHSGAGRSTGPEVGVTASLPPVNVAQAAHRGVQTLHTPFSMLRESMARYPALTRPCLAPAAITAWDTGRQDGLGMCSSQPSSPTKDSLMARTWGTSHSSDVGQGQTTEVKVQPPLTGGHFLPSPLLAGPGPRPLASDPKKWGVLRRVLRRTLEIFFFFK